MPFNSLNLSCNHPLNGMTLSDMKCCEYVANELDEVIIFRSTGPWAKRWIERAYPTKNFHVKGKSSDWGPQAGFIPFDGSYSKVGYNEAKARKGTKINSDAIRHNYSASIQLKLSEEELDIQLNQKTGRPPTCAVADKIMLNARDFLLVANRTGDNKPFVFRANKCGKENYDIFVYPTLEDIVVDELLFKKKVPRLLNFEPYEPLNVMTSIEVGAENKPMTGDYDLMSVCPRWNNYGELSKARITKPGLNLGKHGGIQKGLTFEAGINLDMVLDMKLNSGARPESGRFSITYQGLSNRDLVKFAEHPDMGNLTPRILRCLNALNDKMNKGKGALRRVHHNAESHRNHIFNALNAEEMRKGEGFPLTVFQPKSFMAESIDKRFYGTVHTIETMDDFQEYAEFLNSAGFFLQRNWAWGMSIRDKWKDFKFRD